MVDPEYTVMVKMEKRRPPGVRAETRISRPRRE